MQERNATRSHADLIHVQTSVDCCLQVLEPIGDGECQLQFPVRPGFLHVVAADTNAAITDGVFDAKWRLASVGNVPHTRALPLLVTITQVGAATDYHGTEMRAYAFGHAYSSSTEGQRKPTTIHGGIFLGTGLLTTVFSACTRDLLPMSWN